MQAIAIQLIVNFMQYDHVKTRPRMNLYMGVGMGVEGGGGIMLPPPC